MASFINTQRDALTAANGDMIYNTPKQVPWDTRTVVG